MKKKEKKILLIGGGRWAQIYLEELKKIKINVDIITSNKDLIKKIKQEKNVKIKIISRKINFKKINNSFIILANKTEDRLTFLKKFKTIKNEILIEKPLSNNPIDYFKKNLNNKNIYLSLQFYFSKYFWFIKNLIKVKKIKSIQLEWIDNINENKVFNNIHFIEDAYYHFFSIIRIFLGNKNLINEDTYIKKNKIVSQVGKTKITLIAKKKNSIKKRNLKIILEKNFFNINFKNIDKVYISKNNKRFKIFTDKTRNIPIQINNFINKKQNIKNNSLQNLSFLFKDLKHIKDELSKT